MPSPAVGQLVAMITESASLIRHVVDHAEYLAVMTDRGASDKVGKRVAFRPAGRHLRLLCRDGGP